MLRGVPVFMIVALFLSAACGGSGNSGGNQSGAPSPAANQNGGITPAPVGCSATPALVPATIPGVPTVPPAAQKVTTTDGLQYIELASGSGPQAQAGHMVSVHYTGWLPNGTKFDSSRDRNQPFSFTLGAGQVIKGWDEGVAGMHVGEQRRLIVPPNLAYGPQSVGAQIPLCATLIFDVELLSVS